MLICFCHSYDQGTEVVDSYSIQPIPYLGMTASPELRVLICMQAKLLLFF